MLANINQYILLAQIRNDHLPKISPLTPESLHKELERVFYKLPKYHIILFKISILK
jgi:hypothetical protein